MSSARIGKGNKGTSPNDTGSGLIDIHNIGPCACCMALALVKRDMDNGAPPAEHVHEYPENKRGPEALLSKLSIFNPGRDEKNTAGQDARTVSAAEAADRPEVEPLKSKEADTSTLLDDWDSDLIKQPAKRKLWQGWDGLTVMTFGVMVPFLMILFGFASCPKRLTLVAINHPVETIAEILMLLAVPAINFRVWSSLCKNSIALSLRHSFVLGIAAGTSLMVALACLAGVIVGSRELESHIGTGFNTGFCFLVALSLSAGLVAAYLTRTVGKVWDLPRFQAKVTGYAVLGAIFAVLVFAGAEAMPWSIRIAERMTVSDSASERQQGLAWLRAVNPEQQLRLECTDPRSAGLVGLFIPLKSSTQHQLYFAITGKPYSFRDSNNTDMSSMPDDYLSKNVVGAKIKDLSLVRSSMSGIVHPTTLSSSIDWTLVFKNDSSKPQEARAEIKVPQGGVITGLTLWIRGEPQEATFSASGKVDGVANWVDASHESPAMITDLGRGRVLVHCYPVAQEEELKLRMTFVVPLKADGIKSASLILPKFIATNFGLAGEHLVRLRSETNLTANLSNLKQGKNLSGENILSGLFAPKQLDGSDVLIEAKTPQLSQPVATLDKLAVALEQQEEKRKAEIRRQQANSEAQEQQVVVMIDGSRGLPSQLQNFTNALKRRKDGASIQVKTVKPKYVVQQVERISSPAPRHLVIVVDGSSTIKPYVSDLQKALTKLPPGIAASMIIASQEQEKLAEPISLSEGLKKLSTVQFVGGQDNLKAVIRAAEIAGEHEGGAVLWIHGPQPVLNSEIYIVSSYVSTPRFYELPLDSGDTDTYEFFKNHSEIGPFVQVPRNSSAVASDLNSFLSKWQPGRDHYAARLFTGNLRPAAARNICDQEAQELIALHANQYCHALIKQRKMHKAAVIAVAYGLVTPVSSALVTQGSTPSESNEGDSFTAEESDVDSAMTGASEDGSNPDTRSMPRLQGATNGTIGPISGVNTMGTVRVNNLANLEALFNLFANIFETAFALAGAVVLLHGLFVRITLVEPLGVPITLTPGKRIAIGIALILAGVLAPGLLNWFIASARDANLFS